jgi:uncharacterized tellurite resistance protein B-like protein
MCTTCETSLSGRVARALWSIADDLADSARGWTAGGSEGSGADAPRRRDGQEPMVDSRVAAAALMLEVANADERFSPEEQRMVACTLREEFGLGPVQADRVVRAAQRLRERAPGVWTFTNVLVEALTEGQRSLLTEILERLAYADGRQTWEEHYAVRRISSLLRVEASHV